MKDGLADASSEADAAASSSGNPLANPKFGTRAHVHVLLSEVSKAPWLLPPERALVGKPVAIAAREAREAFEEHGLLCVPELASRQLADKCRAQVLAELDATLAGPLPECEPLLGRLRDPLLRYE